MKLNRLSLYENKLNSKKQKESRSMGRQKQVNRCNKILLTDEEETETQLPTEKQTERSTEEEAKFQQDTDEWRTRDAYRSSAGR